MIETIRHNRNKQNRLSRPHSLTPIRVRLFEANSIINGHTVIHQSPLKKNETLKEIACKYKNRSLYEIYKDEQKRVKDMIANKVKEQNSNVQVVYTFHSRGNSLDQNQTLLQRVKKEIDTLNKKSDGSYKLISRKVRLLKVNTEPQQCQFIIKKKDFGFRQKTRRKTLVNRMKNNQTKQGFEGSPWRSMSRHRQSVVFDEPK